MYRCGGVILDDWAAGEGFGEKKNALNPQIQGVT
jgi:hypothetical protein